MAKMGSFSNQQFQGWWTTDPDPNSAVQFQSDPTVQVNMLEGAGMQCPSGAPDKWIKWKLPTQCRPDGEGTSLSSSWAVTLEVVRSLSIDQLHSSDWYIRFPDEVERIGPIPADFHGRSFSHSTQGIVADRFTIHLDRVIMKDQMDDGTVFTLVHYSGDLQDFCDVCQFQIKDIRVDIQLEEGYYNAGDTVGIIEKKQKTTGKAKVRRQRLEKKYLKFSLCSNVRLNRDSVHGFVRRLNNLRMFGKKKAVEGETELPLEFLKESRKSSSTDPGGVSFCYHLSTDLDPDDFYDDHPDKELYTSDMALSSNNVFVHDVCIRVDDLTLRKEVYRFRTKSKEYSKNEEKLLKVMQFEADKAHIRDLSIERLLTKRGDVAYSWRLLNVDTAGRYEEGDVVGIFPDPAHPNEPSYVDLLTPSNYRDAILAGVITRSYYLCANSPEDTDGEREKICMIGKIKIKVSGAVKVGDFIFASNNLPGIAVTESQLIADRGNWRKKRLLGYAIESNSEPGVKLVTCIVSLLLSISNDQVEELLSKLETSLHEGVDEKLREFRDDVDIMIDGITEIVHISHIRADSKRRASKRQSCRVCSTLLVLLMLGILSCYIFLSPGSPYIKWKCRRGALDGELTFEIENRHDEEYISMKGLLFKWVTLKHKLDLQFDKKKNFTGSYYLNLRRCESENLRKVLGWFSSPPIYFRTQVFAATCDCTQIFHYQKYHEWKEYKSIGSQHCEGEKSSACNQTTEIYPLG